ncbi:hypothetical protein GIB67_007758 [Kingdonia uniflora]|uniref:Protein kinase domain-containing protein n=1 Tax=Kingdonia uniflora TaxID=39325 RepID=A0A7J7N1X7_9MAGN|nr:hypothetical protein GIB67_007758 [Kingdonia uniflora]
MLVLVQRTQCANIARKWIPCDVQSIQKIFVCRAEEGNQKVQEKTGERRVWGKTVLKDKRVVAVKKLGDVIQGEEFSAELSILGTINHMNLPLINDFEPKIADFGLAKLTDRDGSGSEFFRIRGTK